MQIDIIKRDLLLATRSKGDWVMGVIFFAVFLALAVIALGNDSALLRQIAPAIVWLAFLMSALLSFGQIFTQDYEDGTLAQILIFQQSPLKIVSAKFIAYIITALMPLWFAIPLAGLMFNLTIDVIAGLMLSVLIGLPAIAAYGIFASALTVVKGASGVLIVLICAPFLMPVLIFGISAVDIYTVEGLWSAPYKALFGLSLIACATALPAASASIKTGFE